MNDERWAEIGAHFEALRELPPQGRAEGLAVIADEEIRREVASLLENTGDGNTVADVVGSAVGSVALELDHSAVREQRIGPWRLVRRLGQGGQGAVFEGIRDDGRFEQRVAVKILKWENDGEESRRRFREERQILAGLEHPHIGRLLDGGETADGTPYLVMEFIEGQRLDAAARDWPLKRKLELFIEVCSAVAYAHRNLIVHRDLKPANILVTPEGAPKLLDFGIARLVDTNAPRTLTAFQALTPDYASPEQVRGLPISTASDVYSLGVVLYELLTSRKPYKIETTTPLEMDRVICQEPPAPAGLNGELDAILAMALRKEPERRYPGAEQFAEDIRRYLGGSAVHARPDTTLYRARKYVRRHWVSLTAATVALTGICAGSLVALHEAQLARRQFDAVRQLANRFLFDFHDEIAKTPGNVKAREMIVSTALEYLGRLEHDASGDPGLQWEMAVAYARVGAVQGSTTRPSLRRPRDGVQSIEKALVLARPLADRGNLTPDQRREFVSMLTQASLFYTYFRQYDKAASLEREAVAKSGTREERGRALANLSNELVIKGDLAEAAATAEQVLALRREDVKRDPSPQNRQSLASILTTLGTIRAGLTDLERARENADEALVIIQRCLSEDSNNNVTRRRLMSALDLLGIIAGSSDQISFGRFAEAADYYEQGAAAMAPLTKDANDRSSRNDIGLLLDQAAQNLCELNPRKALQLANRAAELIDSADGVYRAEPRIYSACAWRTLRGFAAAESQLTAAEPLLNPTQLEVRTEFTLEWARIKAAETKSEEAAAWFRRAIDAGEDAYRETHTPRTAFQLTRVLQTAAAAHAGPVATYRARIAEVWTEQDRRYPHLPRIERQLADARAAVGYR